MKQKGVKKPKNIRENNAKLLLDLYMQYKELTVPKMAQKLGLSRTTIFNINEKLVEGDMVIPIGKGNSTESGGKRPQRYTLRSDYAHALCFYVGYNFLEAKVFSVHQVEICSKVVTLQRNTDLDSLGTAMRELYNEIISEQTQLNLVGIAVAIHGMVNVNSGICVHAIYFPSWGINVPLASLVAQYLNTSLPIYVDSWVWFKTQVTHRYYPQIADAQTFVLINAGRNGFVAGINESQTIRDDNRHLVGEIGHMIVNPFDKTPCQCGGYGCVESLTDLNRIINKAILLRKDYPDSLIFHSDKPSFADIIRAFKQHDNLARMLLDEVAGWIAIAISNLNLILFPDVILLEGDFCSAGPEWNQMVETKLEKVSLVRYKSKINLMFTEPHNEAILEGAATYVFAQFIESVNIKKL
jgi:predicted NBD/HSP70 family sugar kinase